MHTSNLGNCIFFAEYVLKYVINDGKMLLTVEKQAFIIIHRFCKNCANVKQLVRETLCL